MLRAKGLLAAICVVFVLFPITQYVTLHSNVMDLGAFEYQLTMVARGEWQTALSGHLQAYSLILAPLMSACISAGLPIGICLVGTQALLLFFPAFVFLRIAGIGVALAYVAYSPVWFNAHFDFHYDHLAVPLMLGFFINIGKGRPWWAFLFAGLLAFVKEPFALQTAACGLFMVLTAIQNRKTVYTIASHKEQRNICNNAALKNQFWLAGIALLVAGSGYFYFAVHFALPYFAPTGWAVFSKSGAFSWLGHGLSGITCYIITHPLAIFEEILNTPDKLIYLFVVFGLLAFIPLLAPSYLIPAFPLLAIAMLSRLPNYYDYNTHYTAGLIIPVIFAFAHGLPKARALWVRGIGWVWRKTFCPRPNRRPHPLPLTEEVIDVLGKSSPQETIRTANLSRAFYILLALWILAGHMILSPSPISRLFWSNKVWSYSWRAYVPTEREAMIKAAILKYIPTDPSVSVTTQNTVNWYPLARHSIYASFPLGVIEPITVRNWSNRTWEDFWRFIYTGQMQASITHARYADYVVLDLKRPWFIIDSGCDWLYGTCRNDAVAAKFLHLVDKTRQRYTTVFERDGFMILHKK